MISSTNASFFIAKFLFKKAQNLTFFFNFQQNLVKKFNYLFEELRQDLAQYIFLSALISTISTNFNFFFKVCCSTAVDSMSKIKKQNQPNKTKKVAYLTKKTIKGMIMLWSILIQILCNHWQSTKQKWLETIFMSHILNLYGKSKSELSDKGSTGFKMFPLKLG